MLTLTLIGLAIITGIIFIIIGDKKYNDDMEICGWILSVILTIVFAILLTQIYWKRDIEYEKAKYEELKKEVVQLSKVGGGSSECDLTLLAIEDVLKEVRKMNETIEKNRIYSNSLWLNVFYSREIGELEKINYVY